MSESRLRLHEARSPASAPSTTTEGRLRAAGGGSAPTQEREGRVRAQEAASSVTTAHSEGRVRVAQGRKFGGSAATAPAQVRRLCVFCALRACLFGCVFVVCVCLVVY